MRKQIAKIIEEARKKAKSFGMSLDIDEKTLIDDDHLWCIWYPHNPIFTLYYKDYMIEIIPVGESFYVWDNGSEVCSFRDKYGNGAYYSKDKSLKNRFSSDGKLYKAMSNGSIQIIDNCWLEMTVYSREDSEIWEVIDAFVQDNDNVLYALEHLDSIKTWLDGDMRNTALKGSFIN